MAALAPEFELCRAADVFLLAAPREAERARDRLALALLALDGRVMTQDVWVLWEAASRRLLAEGSDADLREALLTYCAPFRPVPRPTPQIVPFRPAAKPPQAARSRSGGRRARHPSTTSPFVARSAAAMDGGL
ncbi:hypothetical protein [Azospirillum argentinense]|uniref:hypothetical protein n=1 Tax=Azospirillum argentinense TaxID=2970906 RepID=UPI0032DFD47B